MANLIKINGTYGAKIGNRMALTRQGAIGIYTDFLTHCYDSLNVVAALVLSQVEDDMVGIGFTREELEQIETEYLKVA